MSLEDTRAKYQMHGTALAQVVHTEYLSDLSVDLETVNLFQ